MINLMTEYDKIKNQIRVKFGQHLIDNNLTWSEFAEKHALCKHAAKAVYDGNPTIPQVVNTFLKIGIAVKIKFL